MKFLSVVLLSLFISVKSSTVRRQDGTFDANAKTNVKSLTARTQDGIFYENAKTNVKSSTAAQDGKFNKNAKTSVNSSTATEDGTFHENAKKKGGPGMNLVLRNDAKQASQLTRLRRSFSSRKDTQTCYKNYFVGKKPPTGFKNVNVRYICQGKCQKSLYQAWSGCFSTLYDMDNKIPIFAAYVLLKSDWSSIGTAKRQGRSFLKQEGMDADIKNINKNIDAMYSNTRNLPCIHKGHLVPAETYSFSNDNIASTFVYTNAVPQYATFNSGAWATHENDTRTYGSSKCAKEWSGDLYLLTGTSDIIIKDAKVNYIHGVLKYMPEAPSIVIPNSMWTAVCCVSGTGVQDSFAVIGNNDFMKENIHMTKVSVKSLEQMIGGIELFPGIKGCNK